MTGATARAIWDQAAEPARRHAARIAHRETFATLYLRGAVEVLGKLRFELVNQVTRDEDGALADISRELIALHAHAEKEGD